jgi:hypothetical protein
MRPEAVLLTVDAWLVLTAPCHALGCVVSGLSFFDILKDVSICLLIFTLKTSSLSSSLKAMIN